MSENRTECVCARRIADFEKIPQPFSSTPSSFFAEPKVGDKTKESIEENRELLKQMKKEARSTEFDPDD